MDGDRSTVELAADYNVAKSIITEWAKKYGEECQYKHTTQNSNESDSVSESCRLDLFKSGMSLSELSSEYGITKSTIIGWIKDVKEIKVDKNEVITLKEVKELKKEMARIKEENEMLKKAMVIFATRN